MWHSVAYKCKLTSLLLAATGSYAVHEVSAFHLNQALGCRAVYRPYLLLAPGLHGTAAVLSPGLASDLGARNGYWRQH